MDTTLHGPRVDGGRGLAPPVFVVSTGRCGSTMVSNMIRAHPRMLSVSEFFSSLADGAFLGRTLDGNALLRRLGTPRPVGRMLLRNDLTFDEYLYPLGAASRFGPDDAPPVMGATLPHLTDDPEGLWDELVPAVRARPRDTLAAQYRFVFEWLARRFDKAVWIERSGASLLHVPTLARMFPDARFVHLHRDGRDTAISMRGHHVFRMYALAAGTLRIFGLDPFRPSNWPGTSRWMPAFSRLWFRFFSADRYKARQMDLPLFGWLWSNMVERGTRYLGALPPERVLDLRFESVLRSPSEAMSRFIEFVGPGFADGRWLDRIARLPRRTTPRWTRLDPREHAALADACAPGQRILGYDATVGPQVAGNTSESTNWKPPSPGRGA